MKKIIVLVITIIILGIVFYKININSTKNNNGNIENVSIQDTDEKNIINLAQNNEINNNKKSDNNIIVELEPNVTFTMAFTGDIMCHNTMYMDAYNKNTDTYDFSYFFKDIKEYLEKPDITVGNLETTFAGKERGYSSYPTFNTPETLGNALKDVGFDVVTTANNHCIDKGYSGIEKTIDYLDEIGISHTGTYKSKEEQEKILIKNVNGVNIAFLSFTYGTNGIKIPEGKEYSVNLINEETMLNQLNLAKKTNAEFICVCIHWGEEYQTTPNKDQKEIADFLIKNGADLIIGNHPHVPQSMELKKIELDDGTTKEVFVIYSLGNFMADQGKEYTRDSLILNLNYTRNGETGKINLNSATYTPTYIYKNSSASSRKFKILDIEKNIEEYNSGKNSSISSETYKKISKELENIKRIVGEEILY